MSGTNTSIYYYSQYLKCVDVLIKKKTFTPKFYIWLNNFILNRYGHAFNYYFDRYTYIHHLVGISIHRLLAEAANSL